MNPFFKLGQIGQRGIEQHDLVDRAIGARVDRDNERLESFERIGLLVFATAFGRFA